MTTPTAPAVRPKPSATRPILTAGSPGASKLTTIAAVISARNPLRRSPTIATRIVAIPTNRISNGCMDARGLGQRDNVRLETEYCWETSNAVDPNENPGHQAAHRLP